MSQGRKPQRQPVKDRAHERPRRGRAAPRATDDTGQPASGREGGGQRASAGSGTRPAGVGLRPVRRVRRSPERDAAARAALRVLYRDFLADGGVDFVRASRCPPRSPNRRPEDED